MRVMLFLVLAGCSREQRIRDDFELICHSYERSGAAAEKDPSRKATIIAKYVSEHLRSDEVKKLASEVSTGTPEEKTAKFKKAMAESGYSGPCPFFDDKPR